MLREFQLDFYILLIIILLLVVITTMESSLIEFKSNKEELDDKYVTSVKPYIASIRKVHKASKKPFQLRNYYHICTAPILTNKYVLTAAHCITIRDKIKPRDVNLLLVFAGFNDVNTIEGQNENVKKIHIHPLYKGHFNSKGNLAVVELTKNFIFNKQVNFVQISHFYGFTEDVKNNGVMCAVMGWGMHWLNSSTKNKFQQLQSIFISNNKCQEVYPDISLTSVHFCSNHNGYGTPICLGNDAAVLMCLGILTGIAYPFSNEDCVDENKPNIFLSLDVYADWFEEISELHKVNYSLYRLNCNVRRDANCVLLLLVYFLGDFGL